MKNKLVWRLGKLPSPEEVRELVKDKIITQEEAREVLFKTETEDEEKEKPKVEDLKSEIKFLRELVEKLSSGSRSTLIEYIYQRPWTYPWYQPYVTWCSSVGSGSNTLNTINSVSSLTGGVLSSSGMTGTNGSQYVGGTNGSDSFTNIATF
jgi:hypothetical protein